MNHSVEEEDERKDGSLAYRHRLSTAGAPAHPAACCTHRYYHLFKPAALRMAAAARSTRASATGPCAVAASTMEGGGALVAARAKRLDMKTRAGKP